MTSVSLVMPVWRPNPDWFPLAVESALSEDIDIEVILVDDGNDSPVAVPVDDDRVRIVRAAHRGPYGARDEGLAVARGTHVRFVDADDVVVAGSTTRLLRAAEQTPGSIVHGVTEVCDDELRPVSMVGCRVRGDATDDCLLGDFSVFHVSLLYPREVVERVGPWDVDGFTVSGDWDYVQRAVELAPVTPVSDVVTQYRRNAGSVMSTARVIDGGRARRLVVDRHFDRQPHRRGTTIERHAYGALHLAQASAHAWRGERVDAARSLALGMRHRPLRGLGVAGRLLVDRARLALRHDDRHDTTTGPPRGHG